VVSQTTPSLSGVPPAGCFSIRIAEKANLLGNPYVARSILMC
jgi:hypothetical protein